MCRSQPQQEPPAGGPATGYTDMLALIEAGEAGLRHIQALCSRARETGAVLPASEVEVLAPIPRPRKNIFCVGRNYAEHAAESFRASGEEMILLESPNIFTKAVTAVNGPYADIPFDPAVSRQIDWEVELAVVIGRGDGTSPRRRRCHISLAIPW